MFLSSNEHVFARIRRLHARAHLLVYGNEAAATAAGDGGPPELSNLVDREAASLSARVDLRLARLATELGLDALSVDVLLCLLMADCDPFSRTLLRASQRELGRPWLEVGTIAELLELPVERSPELRRALSPSAPLRRWALIEHDESEREVPLVAARWKIVGRVAQHLTGDDELPDGMTLRSPRPSAPDASREASTSSPGHIADASREALMSSPGHIADAVAAGSGDDGDDAAPLARAAAVRARRALSAAEPLVIEIVGRAFTGRLALAESICDELGAPLFALDLAHEEPRPLSFRLAEARREAKLAGALLVLRHLDRALPSAAPPPGTEGPPSQPTAHLPAALARFFEEMAGVVFLTCEEQQPLVGLHAPSTVTLTIPFPSPSERARLLERALAAEGLHAAGEVDLVSIARRFALDPRRIEIAGRVAGELARDRDAEAAIVGHAEIVEACRRQVRHDLQSLASRVVTSHQWEDLVIPVDVYHSLIEMIGYVRHAQKVYDEWGFSSRHSLSEGVSALFAGPPGTGKTMCASVMARELDMELFRVDLSRVVSKWIGETEKNLSKVFDEAQHSNAIILFDEADSLFAKRTEVKSSVDRYANLEVNYLLQRMEAFGGVTILTTNFEDTIDTAFKRRLTFRMRFERPDAAARAALWKKVFPASCSLGADFDPVALGRHFEMSGGSIRNAAVRAAFYAAAAGGPIDQATCLKAAEREAGEMGQLTSAPPPAPPPEPTLAEGRAASEPKGDSRLVRLTRSRKPKAD